MEIDEKTIFCTNQVKILRITIDSKLKFDAFVKSLYVKPNRSASACSRVAGYLQQPQERLLYNSFVMLNFKYCPLIWMRLFAYLLIRSNQNAIYVQNLRRLMMEIYKMLHHLNPPFISEFFSEKRDQISSQNKWHSLAPLHIHDDCWHEIHKV